MCTATGRFNRLFRSNLVCSLGQSAKNHAGRALAFQGDLAEDALYQVFRAMVGKGHVRFLTPSALSSSIAFKRNGLVPNLAKLFPVLVCLVAKELSSTGPALERTK